VVLNLTFFSIKLYYEIAIFDISKEKKNHIQLYNINHLATMNYLLTATLPLHTLGMIGLPQVLLVVVLGGLLYLLPILIILFSNKTSGTEKLAWVLAVIFISWFAWIFYLLLAPIKKE
jgi:hypothetical protein